MWSLRRFRRAASRILDEIPPPLLEGLNGGVLVSPGACRRGDDPPGVYLLGEYRVHPGMGRMIVLHYGSFRRVLGDAPWQAVVEELRRTIRHELRHHLEHRAGLADLEREDELERRRFHDRFATRPHHSGVRFWGRGRHTG